MAAHAGRTIIKIVISAIILAVGLVGTVGLILMRAQPEDRKNVDLVPMVQTYVVDEYRGELDLVVTGLVVPYREIKLAAEVSGRVEEKTRDFQPGSFVKVGTVLLRIDPREYQIEARRLQAEVEQAETMLAETEQELRGATDRWEVAKQEFKVQEAEYLRRKDLSDALSKSEMTKSEQAYLSAQAALQNFESNVITLQKRKTRMTQAIELAKLQSEKTQLDLERTTIRAPVDGVIVAEMVEQGDYVQRGQQLLALEDTEKSEVRCNLTHRQLNWILENSPGGHRSVEQTLSDVYQLPKTRIKIYESSRPDLQWSGTLERFDGIGLDEKTKTIPCRIVVDQPVAESGLERKALVRGTYVKCQIEISADQMIDQGKRFVQFPESALQPGGYVWLIESGLLARRSVSIVDQKQLENGDGRVIVQWTDESLQPGNLVIVSPLTQPVLGTPVQDIDAVANGPQPSRTVPTTAGSSEGDQNSKPVSPQG